MEPSSYWEANGHTSHPVKYESETAVSGFSYCGESGLNFATSAATYSEDDAEYTSGRRGKTSRQDPLSHRIIEKRRRDRMNSCLADLSRLIPPQYQRKGRGRIEKTEIIEMAIRHIKNIQKQDNANRDTTFAEQYRLGYNECVSEAAKFLVDLSGHFEDICYKMVTHLKDHCNDIMKGEYFKSRANIEPMRGSSGTPPTPNYHHSAPLSQLRDMLTSDVEHSNDHNDVKDLSFRSQPQQAAVITSTAPIVLLDTNHSDIDLTRSSSVHNHHHHLQENGNSREHESVLRTVRMRKISETSTDIEHNNNNYKFKNYIQQRFSQDNHHHDDNALTNFSNSSEGSERGVMDDMNGGCYSKKRKIISLENNSCDEQPTTNGITDFKSETMTPNSTHHHHHNHHNHHHQSTQAKSSCSNRHPSISVPIFALHSQGAYYIPMTIDYDALLPYMGGVDILEKSFNQMTPLHPINIHVQFNAPPLLKANACMTTARPKIEGLMNGW